MAIPLNESGEVLTPNPEPLAKSLGPDEDAARRGEQMPRNIAPQHQAIEDKAEKAKAKASK